MLVPSFSIQPLSRELYRQIKNKIDLKTKPAGALGRLEEIALQAGLIQNTLSPALVNPHIIVFAGDHGIAEEGVSAYPQEVSYQMVYNFLNGGAAINVFCKQHGIKIKIVDAGLRHLFEHHPDLIISKTGEGTKNFSLEPAMDTGRALHCIQKGAEITQEIQKAGCNVIGFGDMGIGNTTSASALMHAFTGIDLPDCVGRGTGVNDEGISHKINILKKATALHHKCHTPVEKLAALGGFEIAHMAGAMLKAAELKMILMVDGFIATSAFLVAERINKNIHDYAIFCHQSEEKGHKLMLEYLKAKPLLKLNMRLGEGTGCAVAWPFIQSAVNFLNEMASFESAGVSDKKDISINA